MKYQKNDLSIQALTVNVTDAAVIDTQSKVFPLFYLTTFFKLVIILRTLL